MAFTPFVAQDYTDYNIAENSTFLNEETGVFQDDRWSFEETQINTGKTEFRRKYIDKETEAISFFLISFKTAITDGDAWSEYQFYKEV